MPPLPAEYYASNPRQPPNRRSSQDLIFPLFPTTSSDIRPRSYGTDIQSSHSSISPTIAAEMDPRELYFMLPLSYKGLDSGPSPGTVVGITLGSVIGYLIIIWILNSLITQPGGRTRYVEGDRSEVIVTRRSERSGRRHRSSRRARRPSRSETQSSSSGEPPPRSRRRPSRPPSPRRTERIIREEVKVRTESRPPVAMPMPPPMPEEMRETINININEDRPERRVEGDDIVEVIEESSDISPERSRTRRSRGGYRAVDPGAYAGGNYPQRDIRSSSRRR